MQTQGLLQGPITPGKQTCRYCSLASRLATTLAAPSCPSAAPSVCSTDSRRRRQFHTFATSASIEDLDERTTAASSSDSAASSSPIDSIEIVSEAGQDYEPLREALRAQEFEKADEITRDTLIQLAGPGAIKRGWVYFTEVKAIGEGDLRTMDALWRAASDKKFGFSVQREIWLQQRKYWSRFFKKIDWTQGPNNNYRKWPAEFTYTIDAAKGHLPLTNALRGTQLLQAILEHPAFDQGGTQDNGGKPSWLT